MSDCGVCGSCGMSISFRPIASAEPKQTAMRRIAAWSLLSLTITHCYDEIADDSQIFKLEPMGGSFPGHMLPGVFFLVVGLRYFYIFVRQNTLDSEAPYSPQALHSGWDVVAWLVMVPLGMYQEYLRANFHQEAHLLYAATNLSDKALHYNFNNLQHIQLYFMFSLVALAAWLERRWPQHTPRSAGMIMGAFAFAVDSFEWYVHSMAKEGLHRFQHMIFCFMSFALFVTIVLEMSLRIRRFLALRAFFVVMTGGWFMTMGITMKTGWPVELVNTKILDGRLSTEHYENTALLPAETMMMINAVVYAQLAMSVILLGAFAYFCVHYYMYWNNTYNYRDMLERNADYSVAHTDEELEIGMTSLTTHQEQV